MFAESQELTLRYGDCGLGRKLVIRGARPPDAPVSPDRQFVIFLACVSFWTLGHLCECSMRRGSIFHEIVDFFKRVFKSVRDENNEWYHNPPRYAQSPVQPVSSHPRTVSQYPIHLTPAKSKKLDPQTSFRIPQYSSGRCLHQSVTFPASSSRS